MHDIFLWFSVVSFFFFGVACFVSAYMRAEFTRYGLSGQRGLVGALQVAGAAGLVVGLSMPVIGQLAAGGLALLMLLGVGVRIKIRDTVVQTVPAFTYMVLNLYLALTWPG